MNITTVEMNRADPNRLAMSKLISPSFVPPAEKAANTSGAPLPSASKVTPARLSEQLNLSEIVSKAGERYVSAVEAKLYMAIPKKSN